MAAKKITAAAETKSRRATGGTATRTRRGASKSPKRTPRKAAIGDVEAAPPIAEAPPTPVMLTAVEEPRREGLRAKMIPGLPEAAIVPLEIAYFSDNAVQVRGQTGLILGVGVTVDAVISYGPVPIPRVRDAKRTTLYVSMMAETPGVEAVVDLRVLATDGQGLSIPSPLVDVSKNPILRFVLPMHCLGQVLTAALRVSTRSTTARPIVRAAWIEVES